MSCGFGRTASGAAPSPPRPRCSPGHRGSGWGSACSPRTLRLSGELADGTILHSGTTPGQLRRARELIGEGRAAAGRTDPHSLVVYRPAVPGDAAAAAEAVRSWTMAGVDTLVLHPTPDNPDPVGFVRFAAEQVRPLLGP